MLAQCQGPLNTRPRVCLEEDIQDQLLQGSINLESECGRLQCQIVSRIQNLNESVNLFTSSSRTLYHALTTCAVHCRNKLCRHVLLSRSPSCLSLLPGFTAMLRPCPATAMFQTLLAKWPTAATLLACYNYRVIRVCADLHPCQEGQKHTYCNANAEP